MKRKAMNANQLAKRIHDKIEPDTDGETRLEIDRDWKLDMSLGLLSKTADELATLHGRLCRAIPDDLDFSMLFLDGRADLALEFVDGPNAGSGMMCPFPLDRNLLDSLRNFDWNEYRVRAINGSQFHDNVIDAAEHLPSRLESTATNHRVYGVGIEKCLQHAAKQKLDLVVLSADTEECTFRSTKIEHAEDLLRHLGDEMINGRVIIAVVSHGELLDPEATDRLKQDALDRLGPISRAKAEGRFEAALEAMKPI